MEKAGGHTLEKHVGKTYDDLFLRAMRDTGNTITTFTDKRAAINAVKENLKYNAEEIALWINSNSSIKTRVFECSHPHSIGNGILNGKSSPIYNLKQSKIVLEKNVNCELGFKILTAYPIIK